LNAEIANTTRGDVAALRTDFLVHLSACYGGNCENILRDDTIMMILTVRLKTKASDRQQDMQSVLLLTFISNFCFVP